MLCTSRKAAEKLGLHPNTLRKYADNGLIKHIRTPKGQRLYDVDSFCAPRTEGREVIYVGTTDIEQKDNLNAKLNYLRRKYPRVEIIGNSGYELNFERKDLQTLLESVISGDRIRLLAADRDRIVRLGCELVEHAIKSNGGELVVLDPVVRRDKQELTEDLLKILRTFSLKMYGNNRVKKNTAISYSTTEEVIAELVRRLSLDL